MQDTRENPNQMNQLEKERLLELLRKIGESQVQIEKTMGTAQRMKKSLEKQEALLRVSVS